MYIVKTLTATPYVKNSTIEFFCSTDLLKSFVTATCSTRTSAVTVRTEIREKCELIVLKEQNRRNLRYEGL